MNPRRLVLGFAFALAALALVVPAASAHPLGNFTINHYNGLRIGTTAVLVDHVTDFAEIPTFTERRGMDTDSDGAVSDSEASAYAAQKCTALASELDLSVGGTRVGLDVAQRGISFPMGDPWAHLDLADGSTLSMHALQRYDGERAIAAAHLLRRLVSERGEAADGD